MLTKSKTKLPELLASGQKARLIPVGSEGSKEGRATSILLSTLSAVDEFAHNMFGSVGVRVGSRTNIEVYTEIVFADKEGKSKLRPDGLIIINTGKGQWTTLVEAKIGNSELSSDQIRDYLALAKKYKIDAVITISNQYAAIPTHHPVPLKKSDLKGVGIYHWSWMFALTEAILLLKSMGVKDEDQRFLLSEMVRYYDHPSVGVSSFGRMNAEWKDVVLKVKSGSKLTKTSDEVVNTVGSWHQEARDLCLILSRDLAVPVSLRLSRKNKNDPLNRLKSDCEQLVSKQTLECELDIPYAASPLLVIADLTRRTLSCVMSVQAPKDKKRSAARLNWLLRQLKDTDPVDLYIRAVTHGRSGNVQAPLHAIRENPRAVLLNGGVEIQPVAFEVIMVKDLAGKFSGRSTFIKAVENVVSRFYEVAGQNLQSWTPKAPKVSKEKEDEAPDLGERETIAVVYKEDAVGVEVKEMDEFPERNG